MNQPQQQQQQQQGVAGGNGTQGPSQSPLALMQTITNNIQAVKRQWASLGSQPDSPAKEAGLAHLKAQMAKLQQMHTQANQMWEQSSKNGGQQMQNQNQNQQQGAGMVGGGGGGNLQQSQYMMAQQLQQQSQMSQQQLGQMGMGGVGAMRPGMGLQGGGNGNGMGMGIQPGMIHPQAQQSQQGRSQPSLPDLLRSFNASKGTPLPNVSQDGGASLAPFSAPLSSNPTQVGQADLTRLFQMVAMQAGGSSNLDQSEIFNPTPQNGNTEGLATKGWAQLAMRFGFAVGTVDPNELNQNNGGPVGRDTPKRLMDYYKSKLGEFEKYWLERGGARAMMGAGGNFGSTQHQRSASNASMGNGQSGTNPSSPQQQQVPPQRGQPNQPPGGMGMGGFPPQLQAQLAQLQQAVAAGKLTQAQAKEFFAKLTSGWNQQQQQLRLSQQQGQQAPQTHSQNQPQQSEQSQQMYPFSNQTSLNSQAQGQGTNQVSEQQASASSSKQAGGATEESNDKSTPRATPTSNQEVKEEESKGSAEPDAPVKRGRGRPRKRARDDTIGSSTANKDGNAEESKKPKTENGKAEDEEKADDKLKEKASKEPPTPQTGPNPNLPPSAAASPFNSQVPSQPQQPQQAQQPQQPQQPSIPSSSPSNFPATGINLPPNVSLPQAIAALQQKYAQVAPQASSAIQALKSQSTNLSPLQKEQATFLVRQAQTMNIQLQRLQQQYQLQQQQLGQTTSSNPLSAQSPSGSSISLLPTPQASSEPSEYSISYIPTIREVSTFGGLDINGMNSISWDKERERQALMYSEKELWTSEDWRNKEGEIWGADPRTGLPKAEGRGERLEAIGTGRGKAPRGIGELGLVDISNLILSLKSRLEVEVTIALNTLLILTSGVGAPRGFRFHLEPCEDLTDELLDLLIENSWREGSEITSGDEAGSSNQSQSTSSKESPRPQTSRKVQDWLYGDWLQAAEEDEGEMRMWKRFDRLQGNASLDSTNCFGMLKEASGFGQQDATTVDPPIEKVSEVEAQNDSAPTSALSSSSSSSTPLSIVTSTSQSISTSDYFNSMKVERSLNSKAAISKVVLNIFSNAIIQEDNKNFLSGHPRFWDVIASLIEEGEKDVEKWEEIRSNLEKASKEAGETSGNSQETSIVYRPATVFTTYEQFKIRKEVVQMLSQIGDESLSLTGRSLSTVLTLWRLLRSFILDDSTLQDPTSKQVYVGPHIQHPSLLPGAILPMSILERRVPFHLDLALGAFTKISQPDQNREVFSTLFKDEEIIELLMTLLRRLPIETADLMLLGADSWTGHLQRVVQSMYSLVFLANQNLKKKIRKQLGGVLSGVLMHLIKQLTSAYPDWRSNTFQNLITRMVEFLKLLDKCPDTLGSLPLLGMGMGLEDQLGAEMEKEKEKNNSSNGGLLVGMYDQIKDISKKNIDPRLLVDLQEMQGCR